LKINWKKANLFVFAVQLLICLLGTFYKHISFGHGIGDILFYILMYVILIVYFILIFKWGKKPKRLLFLLILSLIVTIYIMLEATFFRGSEYPWNGNIFYEIPTN